MEEKAPALSGRTAPGRGIRWKQVVLFLGVIGPGLITANVDNDAGGITTYSLAGAQYGTRMLWTLIPITIALVVVQEMAARMGAVTGKGLADLIRENFGVKLTFYLMLALLASNYGNTVSEFAGVAASLEIFGVAKWISVPARGARDLAARRARHVPAGRARVPRRVRLLLRLPGVGVPGAPGLEGGPPRHGDPVADFLRLRVRRDARGPRRHDDRALDAVLPAVERGGKGHPQGPVLDDVVGRRRRLHRDRRRGLLHHRGLRGDALRARHRRHERRRRRPLARAPGREIRRRALRVRAPERVGLLGRDPAALDRLLRVRGLRLGGRRRQEVRRGAGVLLASTPR